MEAAKDKRGFEFKVFAGSTCEQMPKLIHEGFVPASAAQIMHGRLEGKLSFKDWHDSGDVIIYHPGGEVELVHDSEDLRKLGDKSLLSPHGALLLPGHVQGSLGGVFPKGYIMRYTSEGLPRDQVKQNPLWQWLAHDNQALLDAYVDEMFRCIGFDTGMGVYVNGTRSSVPLLRLWCLGGDHSGGADGYLCLDYAHSALVGIPNIQKQLL